MVGEGKFHVFHQARNYHMQHKNRNNSNLYKSVYADTDNETIKVVDLFQKTNDLSVEEKI